MEINNYNKYSSEVNGKWGNTEEYKEFERKNKDRTKQEFEKINEKLMNIFIELGKMKSESVQDKKVQDKIQNLKDFITANYYKCSNEILYSLGQMYVNDERFKNNIDSTAGEGTAEFISQAIIEYCSKNNI